MKKSTSRFHPKDLILISGSSLCRRYGNVSCRVMSFLFLPRRRIKRKDVSKNVAGQSQKRRFASFETWKKKKKSDVGFVGASTRWSRWLKISEFSQLIEPQRRVFLRVRQSTHQIVNLDLFFSPMFYLSIYFCRLLHICCLPLCCKSPSKGAKISEN